METTVEVEELGLTLGKCELIEEKKSIQVWTSVREQVEMNTMTLLCGEREEGCDSGT
jgi:hypothetical protein